MKCYENVLIFGTMDGSIEYPKYRIGIFYLGYAVDAKLLYKLQYFAKKV